VTRVLTVVVAVEAGVLAVAGAFWYGAPYAEILVMLGIGGLWAVCGYVSARVTSMSRTGALMLGWAALELFSDLFGAYGWVGNSIAWSTLATAGRLVSYLQVALLLHIAVTFPSGRAGDTASRVLVRTIWIVGSACALATLVTFRTLAE
jgi:hypothetical protein